MGVESRTDVNKSVNSFYPEAAAMGRVVSPAKKLQLGWPEMRNIEAELRKWVQRYRERDFATRTIEWICNWHNRNLGCGLLSSRALPRFYHGTNDH